MMGTTGLNDTDIEKIRAVFKLHKEIEKAVLYGSRAKGTYKPASDIDLVLVGDALNLTIQQAIENELDDLLLPYKFDVSLFQQIENKELISHIERVGAVFFDNN
jgi:type I restriction enzyme S subunit